MKYIVFDIETIPQDETKLLALAPEFAAPANLKDPEKITAAIARKRAHYLADAALNWKTAEIRTSSRRGPPSTWNSSIKNTRCSWFQRVIK